MSDISQADFDAWWSRIAADFRNPSQFRMNQPVNWAEVARLEAQFPGRVDPSYSAFLRQYGECRMVRIENCDDCYELGIVSPHALKDDILGAGFFIGHTQVERVGYWAGEEKAPQWEPGKVVLDTVRRGGLESVWFRDWFVTRFERLRKGYSAKEWAKLCKPPKPFTACEAAIVEARALFEWKLLSSGSGDRLVFEVTNGSTLTLPFLSIGITWGDGSIGGVWLDVSSVGPGERRVVEKKAWSNCSTVGAIAFPREPPIPGMQDRYWEFKGKPKRPSRKASGSSESKTQEAKPIDRSSQDPRYGPWKFIHEIELRDLMEHPIWLWCCDCNLPGDEDGPLGGDETSMRPLLNTVDVSEDHQAPPLLLLRIKDSPHYASGLFVREAMAIEAITVRMGTQAVAPDQVTDLPDPTVYVPVPTIGGHSRVEFLAATRGAGSAKRPT